MSKKLFHVKPDDFSPSVEVVAGYFESGGKVLFLKRAAGKQEGGLWGVPGGKVEKGESLHEAMIRETEEETQIDLNPDELKYLDQIFIRMPGVDFIFHMFHHTFDKAPSVILNAEHVAHRWVGSDEASQMPLMDGAIELLEHFRSSV